MKAEGIDIRKLLKKIEETQKLFITPPDGRSNVFRVYCVSTRQSQQTLFRKNKGIYGIIKRTINQKNVAKNLRISVCVFPMYFSL